MTYLMKAVKGVLALTTWAALSLPAIAQDMRPPDAERMSRYSATLGEVLAGAFATAQPSDLNVLADALRGAAGPVSPAGDWNCRTMKLGRLLDLVVYPNFRCRIEADGEGWRIQKVTGSQRSLGTISLVEGQWIYLGVGHVGQSPAVTYGGLPPLDQTPVEPGQTVASVGLFEQMEPGRARLMLPEPILESKFDILYLTR